MTRNKYLLVSFLLILAVALFAGSWLFGTNSGARFAIKQIARWAPGALELGDIKGTLAGSLTIERLKFTSPEWQVSIERVRLRWKPLSILGGWVHIGKISLEGFIVNDLYPEVTTPYDFSWPHVPGWLSWLKARLKSIQLHGFRYEEAGRQAFAVYKVGARATWYLGSLHLKILDVSSPLGSADGTMAADFGRSRMSLRMHCEPTETLKELSEFDVELELAKGYREGEVSGPLSVIALSGNRESIKVTSSLSLVKGRVILEDIGVREMGRSGTAGGKALIDMGMAERPFDLNLHLDSVGLTKDPGSKRTVSGMVAVKGDRGGYKGSVNLKSSGEPWEEVSLGTPFEGDFEGIRGLTVKGKYLGGTIHGSIEASWSQGLQVSGNLEAKGLNPALITEDWPGTINGEVRGNVAWSQDNESKGSVRVRLLESVVRQKGLKGTVNAEWAGSLVNILDGELKGSGFHIVARGALQERLQCTAKVSDLGALIPKATGQFSAAGWVRLWEDHWTGTMRAESSNLHAHEFRLDSASVDIQVGEKKLDSIRGRLQARNAMYGLYSLGSPGFTIEGRLSQHDIRATLAWPEASAFIQAQGGYEKGTWRGTVNELRGTDKYAGDIRATKPASLVVSRQRITLTPLELKGNLGEIVEIDGDLYFEPLRGHVSGRWESLNLARVNPVVREVKVEGELSGFLRSEIGENKRLTMRGVSSGKVVLAKEQSFARMTPTFKLDWDNKGINVVGSTDIEGGGHIEGRFFSAEAGQMQIPGSGILNITWSNIDMAPFSPLFTPGLRARGKVSGSIRGKLLQGSCFDVSGETRATETSFIWRGGGGFVRSTIESVGMKFNWKDSALKGNADFRFSDSGRFEGTFNLPFSAQFPLAIDQSGPVDIAVKGEIRERGMVSIFFPRMVEETEGHLSFDLVQTGTWKNPQRKGQVVLKSASAYLPTTGIRIRDITAEVSLTEHRIELESFRAVSGTGYVQGHGTFELDNWGLRSFRAKLTGQRFQIVYLPELQLLANPDLTIEGDAKRVRLRGAVTLPEGMARDRQDKAVITSSEDVIIVDRPKKVSSPMQTVIDTEITVVFGEKVRIQVEGLEGRLAGRVVLTGQSLDRILGKGTVHVVDGKFASYGIKLDVTRANIVLDGGPVEKASLDIMAIKTVNPGSFDEVRAGVTVTGTPISPLIQLYSEPPMPEGDVLSYLLFGSPLRAGSQPDQTALLMKSAGVLFGGSQGAGLQDQIQRTLGLDTLGVVEGPSGTYASSRTAGTGSLQQSLVTVGKYLSPRLYVAYGRSVFSDEYLFSARYSLGKRIEIESRTGTQTSVDLYYKVHFF